MCTLSVIPHKAGYRAAMNRDEQRSRVTALPPVTRYGQGIPTLGPCEPSGGTWISVNAAGMTLALLNWYSVPSLLEGDAVSRGTIVKQSAGVTDDVQLAAVLNELPLTRMRPFRLVAVHHEQRRIVERQWDGIQLRICPHPWRANIWSSSGFDERGAQASRRATFDQFLDQSLSMSADAQRRLHASHDPESGPYSICMHRQDAATVSYTEIAVEPDKCRMSYCSLAPCQHFCPTLISDMVARSSRSTGGITQAGGKFGLRRAGGSIAVRRSLPLWLAGIR